MEPIPAKKGAWDQCQGSVASSLDAKDLAHRAEKLPHSDLDVKEDGQHIGTLWSMIQMFELKIASA